MTRIAHIALPCAAALALAACEEPKIQDLGVEGRVRPVAGADGGGAAGNCDGCHGDPARAGDALVRAAPPAALLGRDPGAHLAHVTGTTFRAPLGCAECHYVPTLRVHADGNVAVTMVGLGAADSASPAWDEDARTCSGVYCHGATLGGGPAEPLAWFVPADLGCASCHGSPPPAPHAAGSACGACHAGYTSSSVNPATHLNGAIDASGGHPAGFANPAQHGYAANGDLAGCRTCHGAALTGGTSGVSCDSCHGGAGWRTDCTFCHGTAPGGPASPPVDTQGRTDRAWVSIGAHAAHVATSMTAPLACADCHPDRSGSNATTDAAHVDGDGRAEVVLGARAGAGAAYVRASDTSATCSSTACHGAAPVEWTSTAPLGCDGCHGAPPPTPHSTNPNCGGCHSGYTASSANPATHLDGTVQSSSGHAPGYASSAAHGAEVNRVGLTSCTECHGADLAGGVSGYSCNMCHGGTAWRSDCTFCHGTDPAGPASPPVDTQGRTARSNVSVGAHAAHVTTAIAAPLACTVCHPDRTGSDVLADTAHVDGDARAEVVFGPRAGASADYDRANDTSATCASTACHGPAPIEWTSTTALGCDSCHGAPPATHTATASCDGCHPGYTASSVVAATHVDGTVQATNPHATGYADPTVHGYEVNRTGLGECRSCHGTALASCDDCHTAGWRSNCTFCHGADPSGPASPPKDTQGRTLRTNVSVGAHAAHVATALTEPLACADCHPDRAGDAVADAAHVDGDGRAEVALSARAGPSATYVRASDSSATCSSTSCHGAATVEWTSTAPLGCGSCHGAPPPSPHPADASCGDCHPGYDASTVNPETHLDGAISGPHDAGYASPTEHGYAANAGGLASCASCHGAQLGSCDTCHAAAGSPAWATDCTFCHGTPGGSSAPPVDAQGRSATTNVSVGLHAAHVGTTIATPLACTQCHADRSTSNVKADAAHVDGNGIAEVVFAAGSLATTGNAPASYQRVSATSATCASTYCHGRFSGGADASGARAPLPWTGTAQGSCNGSCHGTAASPRPASSIHTRGSHEDYNCVHCHATVVNAANAIIAPALHVNGVDNVVFGGGASGTYNGGTSCSNISCH